MKVGIPKEIEENETRVSLIPQTVKKLTQRGIEVLIESRAGEGSFFKDKDYEDSGARIVKSASEVYLACDIIIKIRKPQEQEINKIKEGAVLVSLLYGSQNPDIVQKLSTRKITAFALDSVPRITRAQTMDVLSSMSTITGYKAVLIAADNLPKFFPMLMTAAGTVAPAKVFIIGAGVAGLQAIATAKRLGAVVEAFDTRPLVKEQVESLGGRFVALDLSGEKTEGEGGYAKEVSKELHQRELELISKQVKKADVVITTALVPGKKAPILITEDMVKEMQTGSIIIDLASEQGGNCELTSPGEKVVKFGVTICGYFNLPGLMQQLSETFYILFAIKKLKSICCQRFHSIELYFTALDIIDITFGNFRGSSCYPCIEKH